MSARGPILRDAIVAAIDAAKTAEDYNDNSFSLQAVYYPTEDVSEGELDVDKKLIAETSVHVVALGSDRRRIVRSNKNAEVEQPIQICLQRAVNPTDVVTMDSLHELLEQIQYTVEQDFRIGDDSFGWLRNESLKDPDTDTPYSFDQLRSNNTFRMVFTAFYKHIHTRS